MLIKKNFKNIIILSLFLATFISASFEIKSVASANNEYLTKKAVIVDGTDASNQGNVSCSNSTSIVDQDPICKDKIRWVLEYKNDTGSTVSQRTLKDNLEIATQSYVAGSVKLPNTDQYSVSYNGATSTEPIASGVNNLQFNLNNIGAGNSAGAVRASIDQSTANLSGGYDPVIYYNQTLGKKIACSLIPDSPTYTISANTISIANSSTYNSFDCVNLNDGSASYSGRKLLSSNIGSVVPPVAKTDIFIGHSPDLVVSSNGRYIYYAGIKVDLTDKNKSVLGVGCLDIEKFENCGFYSQVTNYQLSATAGDFTPISGLLRLGENFYYAETDTSTHTLTLHCVKGVSDSGLNNNLTKNNSLSDCAGSASKELANPSTTNNSTLTGIINIVGNIDSNNIASIAVGENETTTLSDSVNMYCAKFDSTNGLYPCWGANNTAIYIKDAFYKNVVDRNYIIPHFSDPHVFCGRNSGAGTSEELICYSSDYPSNQSFSMLGAVSDNATLNTVLTSPTNLSGEDVTHYYVDPSNGDKLVYLALRISGANPGIYCYNLTKSQTCSNFGTNGYVDWTSASAITATYAVKLTFFGQCGYALGDNSQIWSFDPTTGSFPCKYYSYSSTSNLTNQICSAAGSNFSWDKITRIDNVPNGISSIKVYVRDSSTKQLIPSVNGFVNPIDLLNNQTASLSSINSSLYAGLNFEVVLEKTSSSNITDDINFNITTTGSLPQICFDTTVKNDCAITQISNYADLYEINTLLKSSDLVNVPVKKSSSCAGTTTSSTTTSSTTTSSTTTSSTTTSSTTTSGTTTSSTTTSGTTTSSNTNADLEVTQSLLSSSPVSPGSTIQIRYFIKNLSNIDSGQFKFTSASITQALSSNWTCSPVSENANCGNPVSGNGAISMTVNNLKAGGILTVLENVTLSPSLTGDSLLNTASAFCIEANCYDLNGTNNTSSLTIPTTQSTTTNSSTTTGSTALTTTSGTTTANPTTSTSNSTTSSGSGTVNTNSLPATGLITRMPVTSTLLLLSISLTIIFNAGFFSKLLTKQLNPQY